MGKPSARKRKKQKERERRVRKEKLAEKEERKLAERRRRYQNRYPGFRFNDEGADPEFVKAVRRAVSQVNFEDKTVFNDLERAIYEIVKKDGAHQAISSLEAASQQRVAEGDQDAAVIPANVSAHLGQVVFDHILNAACGRNQRGFWGQALAEKAFILPDGGLVKPTGRRTP